MTVNLLTEKEETSGTKIWFVRRLMRITWTERTSNDEVIDRIGKRQLK